MSELSRDEMHTALFAQLVMQQANMAMMLMGKIPNPQTGQPMRDFDAAQVFIDQIEMLEAKTKGNLSPPESNLLKQTLMSLRMSYVEAVNDAGSDTAPAPEKLEEQPKEKSSPSETSGEDESAKRFSKKYSL